jgi:hypothetical protein
VISFFFLIRSNLVNPKQKRASHIQQPSSQPMLFIESSMSDNQNIDKPIENKNENDPRSLLGK